MINYNSCIDTFSSRTQNNSPNYSVMKKPLKTKPKIHYFHETIPSPKPSEFIPPVISIKKPLNQSPRRMININLKLPRPGSRLKRNPSLSPVSDNFKYQSLSMDFPKAPIVYSKHKHKQLPTITPMLYFARPNFIRDSSQMNINTLKIKQQSKSLIRNSSVSLGTSNLFSVIMNFQSYIENNYKKMYEEIDIAQKGYITVDDFINLVMFVDLINAKNAENFDLVKAKAEEIFGLFKNIGSSNKVTRKDFYAICSLYEHMKTTSESLNLLNEETCELIKTKVVEIGMIFECYSKNGRIKLKDLHNILSCLKLSDLQLIEGMLYLEVIDFSCFLRFLPLFSWMHENVIKSIDLTN